MIKFEYGLKMVFLNLALSHFPFMMHEMIFNRTRGSKSKLVNECIKEMKLLFVMFKYERITF